MFYAGQSFTAVKKVKAVRSKKIVEKDKKILKNLFSHMNDELKPASTTVDSKTSDKDNLKFSRFQRIKDAERLKMLSGEQ